MDEVKAGDVVELKSGGPPMTVGKTPRSKVFSSDKLKKHDPNAW